MRFLLGPLPVPPDDTLASAEDSPAVQLSASVLQLYIPASRLTATSQNDHQDLSPPGGLVERVCEDGQPPTS